MDAIQKRVGSTAGAAASAAGGLGQGKGGEGRRVWWGLSRDQGREGVKTGGRGQQSEWRMGGWVGVAQSSRDKLGVSGFDRGRRRRGDRSTGDHVAVDIGGVGVVRVVVVVVAVFDNVDVFT